MSEWTVSHSSWEWVNDSLYQSFYRFNDIMHASGLVVERCGYSWSQTANQDFLIFTHHIINNSKADYQNVYLSMYLDLDMPSTSYDNDLADYVDSLNLIYQIDNEADSVRIGMKILNPTCDQGLHFINYNTTPETDGEYYNLIIHTNSNPTPPTTPMDYKILLCTGPYILNAGDTLDFAIGTVAGVGVDDLVNNAQAMQAAYDTLATAVQEPPVAVKPGSNMVSFAPNISSGVFSCSFNLPASADYQIEIYDLPGRKIQDLGIRRGQMGINSVSIDLSGIEQGIYFAKIYTPFFHFSNRLIVIK